MQLDVPCFLLFAVGLVLALQPGQEHVCQLEERYTENVTQYHLKNVTHRTYIWCLQVPPRCTQYRIEVQRVPEIAEVEKTRSVSICCDGYELDPAGDRCRLPCKCVNGVCDESDKCYCNPGFRGGLCEIECAPSRWGRYCRYHCTCLRGNCNSKTGKCDCPPGWIGPNCENQCEYGFYGKDCKGKCGCGDGETCESIGGSCSKSDVTTTPKSVDPPRPPQFDVHVLTTDRITTIPPNVTETIVLRSITVASPGNVSSDDNDDYRPELASIPNGLAITICSGIAAIAIPISAMYVIFVLMRRRTNDTSTDSESKPKSVYHSPLPDPPAYQNQFETEILSSLSAKGCMDLLYDHPPSTGSYRAAAIPEPESSEPLYDEIPCWNNPIVPEETHYANTDNEGNTRL